MFKYLTLDSAEQYVTKANHNTWWEGWNIKVFTPRPRAEFDPKGVYHKGSFGYVFTVQPDANGRYRVKK